MAVTHLFDTTYSARRRDTDGTNENKYRIIIGDKTGNVTATISELDLADPGPTIQWQGGEDLVSKSIMGSSLSFTAILNDDQLSTWEDMVDRDEGDIFCLFIDNADALVPATPYWYGHMLPESISIRVANERHFLDVAFTDGLGYLKGVPWRDTDGTLYTDFPNMAEVMERIVKKLPAYPAYEDYFGSDYLDAVTVPIFKEIALPIPEVDGNLYSPNRGRLLYGKVKSSTFNKPKKNVDRIRELEAPLDYMNTYDVLEDIVKTFGATACMFEGVINIANRQDTATINASYSDTVAYSYHLTNDTLINSASNAGELLLDADADKRYAVLSGAVKRYTMPVTQTQMTHEEGGSDAILMDGFYVQSDGITDLNPNSIYLQSVLASPTGMQLYNQGVRRDKYYNFDNGNDDLEDLDFGFFKQPALPDDYLGFPAATINDISYESGENLRLQLGGNVRFHVENFLQNISSSQYVKVHVGAVLIVRVRIQMRTTDNTFYRLSRTVHTHGLTGGNPDFINIDGVTTFFDDEGDTQLFDEDRPFFRKLYNDIRWVKNTAGGYTDAWYEIIVPHGDNSHQGEDWGAPIYALTQPYDGQVSYAPIGTKIQGDNDGAGVILEEASGDSTHMQYFKIDHTIGLPYGDDDNTDVLSFDSMTFEMGAAEYEHDAGPRGNAAASGTWIGDVPLWRSQDANGSNGSVRYDTGPYHKTYPDFLHFTGLKISIGDGTEDTDLTTKSTGGDGIEIKSVGSTRLGSRFAYQNAHVDGTIHYRKMAADGLTPVSPAEYYDTVKWKHCHHDESELPSDEYDSLHKLVTESSLQLQGRAREMYSMALVAKGGSDSYSTLSNPFMVLKMNTMLASSGTYEYLMPLSYTWSMNDGVRGDFLKVGSSRDITSITSDEGRPVRGAGSGDIGGMPPGVDVIGPALNSKFVTDAITVDADSGDIEALSVKSGVSNLISLDNVSQGSTNKYVTQADVDKLGHITIASAVDLNAIDADDVSDTSTTNKFVTADDITKLGHITVSSAVDLNAIDADDVSDAATTNKFVTADDITKLGHISVTSAVDLNAIDADDVSDASTTNKFVTADDITKLGHISISSAVDLNAIDADDVDDASTTNKFVTADDITKLGHISISSAVDLNAIDADDVDDTSTTNKFVTADDITKLGHITVTSAVDLNNISGVSADDEEKLGHISADASGITSITVKDGSTPINHDEVDYSLDVLKDDEGNAKAAKAIKENPEDITLACKSVIANYEGTYKFTLEDMFTGIVQAGLDQLVEEGFGILSDYTGTTSGILGDFDNDGTVGSSDLLVFLSQYGQSYTNQSDLFQPSRILVTEGPLINVEAYTDPVILQFDSDDTSEALAGSNGINVLADDNKIEFTSGLGLPLSAFPGKSPEIKLTGSATIFQLKVYVQQATVGFYFHADAYDSDGVEVSTHEKLIGAVLAPAEIPVGELSDVTMFELSTADVYVKFDPETFSDPDIDSIKCYITARGLNDQASRFDVSMERIRFELRQRTG